ncbi:MAG: PDC sensor domain-containing protein [Thiotrichales bacterium]|nr:MAG: PDC sensor domain-containing protein [Thiotrichales bacterium]
MAKALQTAVARQRMLLSSRLASPMRRLAKDCAAVWPERKALEQVLERGLELLPYSKYLFILDQSARQITSNISHKGQLPENFDRDRSERPYLADALAGEKFSLSNAYISRNARRPTLTAARHILDKDDRLLGYLGVDFDLRELPLTREVYQQEEKWMQIKGDPAIRGGLFMQQRIDSAMDERIDEVLDLIVELVEVHGVFHAKLHFSSSRATLWLLDDPFRYRILDIEDLTDPGICLAWKQHAYPADAEIPIERVKDVFHTLRDLRFMDETIYLRAGSLNIFNGTVGLNFSCDGSHYMHWSEFLDKDVGFWVGTGNLEGNNGNAD